MRSISEAVNHFKENWVSELSDGRIEQACRDSGMSWINSLLNPVTTIQIFLLQVLFGNTACTHMPRLAGMDFTAVGYCKARLRVKLQVFHLLLKRCVDQLQRSTLDSGKWLGHRIFIVDGSSFSMSDTPTLQSRFGQPGGQQPGCGFPTAHWLAMLHLQTGMITAMFTSPLRTHDMAKTTQLHPELKPGDVLLGDRGFCSYAHLALLIASKVDAVFRLHQRMIVDFTPNRPHAVPGKGKAQNRKGLPRSRWLRKLGVEDQVVQWMKRPRNVPAWMTKEQYDELPSHLTVRELRYKINKKGFRVKQITLVTTLLQHEVYSLDDIAELFRRRWEIETNFGHIKTTMGMDVLKCKTVDGVLRELHAFALVYNLVRQVMLKFASIQNVPVNRISFIDAIRWLQNFDQRLPQTNLQLLPLRPDRYEPRVKKRRQKEYTLMTKPREILKQRLL